MIPIAKHRPCPFCGEQAEDKVSWQVLGCDPSLREIGEPETNQVQVISVDLEWSCKSCHGIGDIIEILILWHPCPHCEESDVEKVHWGRYRVINVRHSPDSTLVSTPQRSSSVAWECDTCGGSGRIPWNM